MNSSTSIPVDRRAWLKGASAILAAATAPAAETNKPSSSTASVTTNTDIVETTAGKVRGYSHDGIHIFKGIPYGASTAGTHRFMPPTPPPGRFGARRTGWGPMVDGSVVPTHPFEPGAPAISANVPMLIGSVLNEFTNGIGNPDAFSMTDDTMRARVKALYGERCESIVSAYRKSNPKARPFELLSLISASTVRHNAVTQAERKAALGAAPAFVYWFQWQTPILDGRPMAFHCAELPFVFDNTDRCAAMTGGGSEARALGAKMSDAWISFARHGDPNHANLPQWPAFNSAHAAATMIFNKKCEVRDDPDGPERRLAVEA